MTPNPAKTPAVLTAAQKLVRLLESADFTTTITREIDGDDVELEVAVWGEWEQADPSVGIYAGYCVHSAALVSDGSEVELTDSEVDELAEAGGEKYRCDMEAAYESAMDCCEDR
jgi:hypothetical protein